MIYENEILDVNFKSLEIAIIKVLFKKYKVMAVSIVCIGKCTIFIKCELLKFLFEAKSILKL
ncbi:TPA: hypothetical protein R9N42_002711 [Clostridium perfringens]|nr:hypothetical protein [Clostridium perfringens]